MRRRRRLFKACKWAMTLFSVALLAVYLISGWWDFAFSVKVGPSVYSVGAGWGLFIANRSAASEWNATSWCLASVNRIDYGWRGLAYGEALVLNCFSFPLLPILIATWVPTAWLWWFGRRKHPPGHCPHCGYDLTGNESGVCPECGRAIAAEAKA